MRRERLYSSFWAALMGAVTAFGAMGCMVTGMRIVGADLGKLVPVCMVSAIIGAVCFQSRLRLLPPCILVLLGGFFWLKGTLNLSLERLVYHISLLYDQGYRWGVLRWSDADLSGTSMMPALYFWSSIVSLTVAWTVIRRCGAWLGVLTAAFPLVICMVLTDTVPQAGYLFLLLFGVILLILTQAVRQTDPRQGNKLSVMAAVPVALALGALFLFLPQEGYNGQAGAQKLQEIVTDWFGELDSQGAPHPTLPSVLDGFDIFTDVSTEKVHLERVGPQEPGMTTVMKVVAPESRTLYLRSCAYDCYDGISWTASQTPWAREMEFPQSEGKRQTIALQTVAVHDTLYFTYTPVQTENYRNGRADNAQNVKVYTISYAVPMGYNTQWDTVCGSLDREEMAQYLRLPQETRDRAGKIVAQQGFATGGNSAGDIYRCAAEITSYVRSSAVYDLGTQSMPGDETDFALWFLESSDTGYCVHYASAATVLLRAAGIPARYVTGYLVHAKQDQTVSVRTRNAHAWVECYIAGIGWIMLEPTAPGRNSPVTQTTEATDATTQTTLDDTQSSPVETYPSPEMTEEDSYGETGANTPGNTDTTEQPSQEPDRAQSRFPGFLLYCLVGVVAAAFQWRLRIWLRVRKQHSGSTNAQALARWQEMIWLSKLVKQAPEESLYALAQKAKFSNHTISKEELRLFDEWLAQTKKNLRKRPIWYQLLYTLILAIY